MNNRNREENEWTLDMRSTDTQIDTLLANIRRLEDPLAQRDLLKLHSNITTIREDISKESVRCRSLNCTTGNMQKLQRTLAESVDVLSQLITMALLMA